MLSRPPVCWLTCLNGEFGAPWPYDPGGHSRGAADVAGVCEAAGWVAVSQVGQHESAHPAARPARDRVQVGCLGLPVLARVRYFCPGRLLRRPSADHTTTVAG
jgi:hypothetical protein